VISRHLGDRVQHWITHNEPWVVAFLGYQSGVFAPGRESWPDAIRAAHHLLVSHGQAALLIRENSPGSQVGITLNLTDVQPATIQEEDRRAARRLDGHVNRWFLDPLYGRGYPTDMLTLYQALGHLPADFDLLVQDDDLKVIASRTDFLGINYYTRAFVRETTPPGEIPSINSFAENTPRMENGWEIYPRGLTHVLWRLHETYRIKKIYITENGASFSDGPDKQGRIQDQGRIDYLDSHLQAAELALASGVPLAGYFLWTLLDNFEWASGTSQRFGIIWTDFQTGARIPKDSARWYRDAIAKNIKR
jgi:beta-glucosidase